MEKEKRKNLTLKDLITDKEMKQTLFASLLGDDNDNYNLFRFIVGKPDEPVLTQRIYKNGYGNSF